MTFTDTPLRPVSRKAMCDCGGEMRPTGMRLDTYPPIYPHECDRCGEGASLSEAYPTVVYLDAE